MTKHSIIALTGLALLLCVCSIACNYRAYPATHTFPNVKVQFVNERTGWIVGPRVFRTQDGGNSWKMIRSDGPGTIVTETIDNEQRRVQFVDERVGFFLDQKRAIYKTVDGGETWSITVSPAVTDEKEKFHTIFFLSPTKGWVLGKNVYRTDDGAVTWTRLGPTPPADDTRTEKPAIADSYPPAVSFLNDRIVVLVRKDGNVHLSEDGGATWRRVWSVNNFLTNVRFLNDKTGWLVGANGFVGRTTDGGATWQQVKTPTSAQLSDVFFLNDRKGWAVGHDGAIIYTTDGGTSWSSAHVKVDGFKTYLANVYFVDEKRGWAVGGVPFDDIDLTSQPSNLILETQDGGQTWTPRDL